MGIFTTITGYASKSARNLKTKTYAQEKRGYKNRIAALKNQQEFRRSEDVREQAGLKQGMFGRGLGKSSIFEQDKDRLTNIQKYRNEAIAKELVYAQRGLSLVKKRYNYQRRIAWAQGIDDLIGIAGIAMSAYSGVAGIAGGSAASQGISQNPSGAPYQDGYSMGYY